MRPLDEQTHDLILLVSGLAKQWGRKPTEDEVMTFIFADEETRDKMWNQVTE